MPRKSHHLEPWNSLAVLSRTGWTVATSQDLAPGHPEKVLMVRRDFAERSERAHLAMIAALVEACRLCDQPENRERIVETLAQPSYVNAPVQALRMSLGGVFDFGHGRTEKMPDFHVFARNDANAPTPEKAQWVIAGMLGSGLIEDPSVVPDDRAGEWFRADIYQRAIGSIAPARQRRP